MASMPLTAASHGFQTKMSLDEVVFFVAECNTPADDPIGRGVI